MTTEARDALLPHPDPDCPRCKGAGVVHPRLPDGQPAYDRTLPCRCLSESRQQYRQSPACIVQHGLDPTQTFETFWAVDGAKRALTDSRKLADGTAEFIWLCIYGGPGCGKTHLAQAATKLAVQRGIDVHFQRTADLFSDLRAAMVDNSVEDKVRRLKAVTMLVLDDYGVEYGTEWEAAKLDEIMTARFSGQLCTMVTTNRDLSEFPERLRSRFLDHEMSRAVHNAAPDYRPRK